MAWRAPLVGYLSACLVLAPLLGPSVAQAADGQFESNPCPFTPPDGLKMTCGTLHVPEHRVAG